MKKYFGYVRVSTVKQGERGVSLQEQRDAILRYAGRFDLTICDWFEEQQTAAKLGRPVWNQMLKLLGRGKADGVMIHKIDRSARNLKDWADLGDLIDKGIEVHFANESLDLHSRGGRLSADIQAVVAADYVRNLREEAKKGIYGRLKQGFYPMRAPIGYCDNGAGKPKTIDPVKGPIVRKAFELYASGRFTIDSLCDELYRVGLRNHAGGKITRSSLAETLNNSFYMGVIRIRRNGQTYLGNHESLVSKRLFETVRNVVAGRLNGRTKIHQFLFRRLIKCKLCGYSLVGETKKGHVYYRCHTSSCPTTGIREDCISDAVTIALQKLQFSPAEKEYLRSAIERLKSQWIEERERQMAAHSVRLQQVKDRLNRLMDAYLDQAIERNLFEERKQGLLFEQRAVEEQLAVMRDHPRAVPETLRKFLELAGDACSLYRVAHSEEKRQLVKIVSSNFALERKTLEFAYAQPFQEVAMRGADRHGGPSYSLARTLDALIGSLSRQSEACAAIAASLEHDPEN